ncbi:MAG TPA: two-component regulator propeller domain-containing protein, partial [Tepidisphaeraceae bacterium]|nr:two-component regulator propeller domain-containing protein [Tepidisphaeraceae bacterium]
GYLWLGTSNGLARFDGVRFTVFRSVDDLGLQSNRILCLYEDRRGMLWVGTEEGGLAQYRNGRFNSMPAGGGLAYDTILSLKEDSAGNLWVGTGSGLHRVNNAGVGNLSQPEDLSEEQVYAICPLRRGATLFGAQNGLYRLRQERLERYPGAGVLPGGSVYRLHEDRGGRLWAGGPAGLMRLGVPGATNSFERVNMPAGEVLALHEAEDGQVWFGTSTGELCRIGPAGVLQAKMVWQFHSAVTALWEDRERNLWIGTAGNGLHRLKRRQLRWAPFSEGLGEARVSAVFETPEGQLWLLTAGHGLYRHEKGRFAFQERLSLPDGAVVQSVCATSGGELWLGTLSDGLFEYQAGALRHFGERDGLSDSAIGALCAGADGGLWVGTRNGGLNHVKDGEVRRLNTPWGFLGNFACVLAQGPEGSLWIGTSGDGLFEYAGGRFIGFTETNGLASGYIHALEAEPDGSLWVGTAKGLCRVKAGRVSSFAGKTGLAEEAILQLRSDLQGNLWFGTSSGIFRVGKEQLEACAGEPGRLLDMVPYGREDGLPGLQCLPHFTAQSRGVWFLTAKGLVLGERRGLHRNTVPPSVLLEAVLVENESVPLSGVVRIPPGKESLKFRYTGLSLTAPGKVCFRYRLEGFDRDWSEATSSRSARYPKVPPGRYRFRVMARNDDGLWNEAGASIALVAVPFWWATAWFRLGMLVAGAGVFAGLYRQRQNRRRELERLRVRIASDLHDDVGSSLWSITLLSRMLAKSEKLEAEEQQDVEEIQRISVQTSNSIRDIIWLINPTFDTLQDLVLRVKDFAGTTLRGLDYRLHCEGVDLSKKLPLDYRQNLFFLLKEALTNIAKHAQAKEVEVRVEQLARRWRFSIRDDGVGFVPTADLPGNGLKNLRARAARMGAELEIQSQPGRGTTLILTTDKP